MSTLQWPLASIYFLAHGQHADGMTEKYPSRTADKIVIRLPDGLRTRIARAAKANGRSVNSEIVELLTEHYPAELEIQHLFEIVEEIMDDVNGNGTWREQRKTLLLWLGELREQLKSEISFKAKRGDGPVS